MADAKARDDEDGNTSAQEQKLLEPYARFREEPLTALQELGLHIYGEGWRAYDSIVGRPIFYPGFSENMKRMVMQQESLQKQISVLANKRVEVELSEGLLGALGVEGEDEANRQTREKRRRQIEDELRQVAEEWTDAM
jgi:hypothetical protein